MERYSLKRAPTELKYQYFARFLAPGRIDILFLGVVSESPDGRPLRALQAIHRKTGTPILDPVGKSDRERLAVCLPLQKDWWRSGVELAAAKRRFLMGGGTFCLCAKGAEWSLQLEPEAEKFSVWLRRNQKQSAKAVKLAERKNAKQK